MNHRLKRKQISPAVLLLILMAATVPLQAQFEQKLSINFYGGLFNTIGSRSWEPDWSTGNDDWEPTLMPNFKTGYSIGASIQVNLSRHFSLEAFMEYMGSAAWYYDASDGDQAAYNYLYYEEYADTIDYNILFSGENEMTLSNLVIGLAPRYYFLPGKKVNPFASVGITYNMTYVNFIDNAYDDYLAYGLLDDLEVGDENYWFTDHSGLGLSVSGGVEYAVNEFIGLFAKAGYYFIPLKKEAFIYESKYADFHSLNLHLGIRLSFLKSKDL